MMDDHSRTPKPTLSRGELVKGFGALAALSMLPGAVAPALADAHDQERQIGQQVYADQRKQNLILDESPYYPIVREVGQRISAAAEPHWYKMNFVIVKGSQANAFSVPGGWVYVNEGLLKNAANNDELASVLGHETGHLVLGHVMNRIHQAQLYQIGAGILGIFIHSQGQATLLNLLANYSFLNFSRQQEYQADHQGTIFAQKAGYNPYGMIWFFRKLQKLYGNAGFEQYVEDHPSTNDRIGRIKDFFAAHPETFGSYKDLLPASTALTLSPGSGAHLIINKS